MEENIFSVKLFDVILPCDEEDEVTEVKDLFLVMEHVDYNLKQILLS